MVLVATVLPWSSTGTGSRNGWDSMTLVLALEEVLHEPLLRALAASWFAVPVLAAVALLLTLLPPARGTAPALRVAGAVLLVAVLAVLAGLFAAGWDVSPWGPLPAVAGGAALLVLPTRIRHQSPGPLPRDPAQTGTRS